MSYRKSFKLIFGVAGGSVALVLAVAAADSRGYFGEQRGLACRWSRLAVQAAQPVYHTPAPTGHSWDFNWDKCVFYGFSPIFTRRYQYCHFLFSNITLRKGGLSAPLKLAALHLTLNILSCVQERPVSTDKWEQDD